MDLTETTRLAAAINALRPDWPQASLVTFITRDLATRAYRDAAVALTYVAADPATQTPKRVLEAGPWWDAVAVAAGKAPATTTNTTLDGRCNCGQWTVRGENHTCARLGDPHAGAAAARAALDAARQAQEETT